MSRLARVRAHRSLILGILSLVLLIVSALWSFDIPLADILSFLLMTLVFIAVLILAGGLGAAFLIGLRLLRKRLARDDEAS
jgi:hypothetical protein